jgi:hypothetical protein
MSAGQQVFQLNIFQNNVFQCGAVATQGSGRPRRYWPSAQMELADLRANYRSSAEERVVAAVARIVEKAVEQERPLPKVAEMAREIRRLKAANMSTVRLRGLIDRIRSERAFQAEEARLRILKQQMEEDDDYTILLLAA